MRVLILLGLLAALVSAKRPVWSELEGYSFEQYVQDFHLDIKESAPEYTIKKELFLAELARVKAHNAKNLSWKEGINKFSAMSHKEKKAFFGRSKGAAKKHSPKFAQAADLSTLNQDVSLLPLNKDWRHDSVMSAVKDQGRCGSCWAFASTATLESHVAIQTGLLFDLSVQQFTSCAPNPDSCGGNGGCEGSTAELAYEYLSGSNGILEEYQYGYSSYAGLTGDCSINSRAKPVATIGGYVQLAQNNYTAVMNAVAKIGPMAINVDASTWSAYESGIYDGCDQKNPDIDHVVVLAGYGVDNGSKYWLVRNSWSAAWGELGYIRLARTDADEEKCGIDTTPQDGIACEDQTEPVKVCGTCGVIYDTVYPTGIARP